MTRRRKQLATAVLALIVGVGLLACFAFGVFAGRRMATAIAGVGVDPPRLVHVAGWRGAVGEDRRFLEALRAGGCRHAMETLDWTDGYNGIAALWYAQRSTAPAEHVATRLITLARDGSGQPIDVTADSSGCGVLLAALATLPADVRVRRVVLSSPAVSCDADLSAALAHVDGGLVAFYSPRDWFICGLGTTLMGTVDNRHTSAAARFGFAKRDARLTQIAYDDKWSARFDNDGGHASTLGPRFAAGYVAPLLKQLSLPTTRLH